MSVTFYTTNHFWHHYRSCRGKIPPGRIVVRMVGEGVAQGPAGIFLRSRGVSGSAKPVAEEAAACVGEEEDDPRDVHRKGQPEGCRVASEVLGDAAAADDADADAEIP